jgi:hypothetical protein
MRYRWRGTSSRCWRVLQRRYATSACVCVCVFVCVWRCWRVLQRMYATLLFSGVCEYNIWLTLIYLTSLYSHLLSLNSNRLCSTLIVSRAASWIVQRDPHKLHTHAHKHTQAMPRVRKVVEQSEGKGVIYLGHIPFGKLYIISPCFCSLHTIHFTL